MQDPPLWQRLLGALAYLLPWSDAIPFGQALFGPLPWLRWLAIPALPVLQLQQNIPLGGLVLFLVLFLAVVRNPQVPYWIRFNVLQAILIDIVLVLLSLAFNILLGPLGGQLPGAHPAEHRVPGCPAGGAVRGDPEPAGQGGRDPHGVGGGADAAVLSRPASGPAPCLASSGGGGHCDRL